MISWLEQVAGELHATFRVSPAAMCARAGCKACGAWLRRQQAVARPGRTTSRRVELPNSDPAPQVWRAPEGPEGTGGLRGAAPEGPEGTASVPVGGGRAWLRCPWAVAGPGRGAGGWRRGPAAVPVGGGGARPRCPWAAAGPGRASRRRAERSSRRGRRAGGPPPTGTPSSPAPQHHAWHTKNRHPDRMSACGGARGIRTPDLLIANETRYQLRIAPRTRTA